jgi:anti-sigma B factor antagonist
VTTDNYTDSGAPPGGLLMVEVGSHPTGVPLVRVTGDLDLATAPDFQKAMQSQVAGGEKFVLDLDSVSFLSSAGLAVLVDLRKQMADHDRKWAVLATRHTVTRPLEITGLLTILPIFTTLPAAVEAVTG